MVRRQPQAALLTFVLTGWGTALGTDPALAQYYEYRHYYEHRPGLAILVMLVLAFIYFLPGIVSTLRGHPNTLAIWVLNIFLGWTFVGWVIALVWAVMRER